MSKWKDEEIQIIEKNYLTMSDEELHKLIPLHSKIAIETKRKDMRLLKPKRRKYSFNDVIDEFSKIEKYVLLSTEDEYTNCNSKIRYICKNHNQHGIQTITLNHLQSGRGCYYCGLESTISKRKIEFDKNNDKKLCESRNFEYIDTIRKNGKITIVFICNNHRDLGQQYMTKKNMERNIKGCKYCSGKEYPEWYVMKKAKEINPHIELLESYKNLTTRIKCFCNKHNYPTNKSMQEILKGQGCYFCGLEKLSQHRTLSIEEYQKKVSNKHSYITVLEYTGINNHAKFKCNLCGEIWESNAGSIRRCHNCDTFYKGEKKISDLLDSWNIAYITQYKFEHCKDKRSLPFDFFLPDHNLCIEFDGLQHFKQVDGWTDLNIIQKHDKIKNEFCNKNNIQLIRIPYWEQEDLEYYLFDKLVEYNILEEIQNAA